MALIYTRQEYTITVTFMDGSIETFVQESNYAWRDQTFLLTPLKNQGYGVVIPYHNVKRLDVEYKEFGGENSTA